MKRFKFAILFGIVAVVIYLSFHVGKAGISSIEVANITENNGYVTIDARFNNFYTLFKGYQYNTEGERVNIEVYSSYGFWGEKEFSAKVAAGKEIKEICFVDGKNVKTVWQINTE